MSRSAVQGPFRVLVAKVERDSWAWRNSGGDKGTQDRYAMETGALARRCGALRTALLRAALLRAALLGVALGVLRRGSCAGANSRVDSGYPNWRAVGSGNAGHLNGAASFDHGPGSGGCEGHTG